MENNNDIVLENFISFCEEMEIVEEGLSYKTMRKLQTNTLALNNQLIMQKKLCSEKLSHCEDSEDCDNFKTWLEKQKAGIQRKINGQEIKNKNFLKKFITLYDSYLHQVESKRTSF